MSFYAKDKRFLAIRLEENEDFYPELKRILTGEDLTTAVLLSAAGMLQEIELGWFNGEEYRTRSLPTPHEILSLTGTVNRKPDGNPFIHCHGTLGDSEHRAFGGHLIRGRVYQTCELVLGLTEDLVFHRKTLTEGQPPRFCPQVRET